MLVNQRAKVTWRYPIYHPCFPSQDHCHLLPFLVHAMTILVYYHYGQSNCPQWYMTVLQRWQDSAAPAMTQSVCYSFFIQLRDATLYQWFGKASASCGKLQADVLWSSCSPENVSFLVACIAFIWRLSVDTRVLQLKKKTCCSCLLVKCLNIAAHALFLQVISFQRWFWLHKLVGNVSAAWFCSSRVFQTCNALSPFCL